MSKYTLSWVLEQIKLGETFDYIFFWGHKPSETGELTTSCLSQWWASPFEVEGVRYNTAEHWMMAQKALLFNDQTSLAKIIAADTPAKAKNLGRTVQGFDLEIWKENCFEIVLQGNLHKFSQYPSLKSFLLKTQNSVLVEASPYDQVWGIGLEAADPRALNPALWEGANLLGFVLMEARDILGAEASGDKKDHR